MRNTIYSLTIMILLIGKIVGQTDSLTLQWEASVHYGTYGQRTVLVNDTLWHLGGSFYYGDPFGYNPWDYSFVEYMATGNNYWSIDTTKTMSRRYGNAESYNGKIYIFGGWVGGNSYLEEVEIFDPSPRTISYGSPLPYPRRNSGSTQYNGKLYLVGGYNSGSYSDRLDIYDIYSDSWSSGASLPIAMQSEAVYYDGKIYVIGGYDGSVHDEVFEYDISSDSWTQIGTSPEPVSAHKLAVYQGHIFVIGDYNDLNRIWKYNISDGSWIIYDSNYIGRRHASTVIHDDKLYILAGNSSYDGVYQYYRIVQSIDLSDILAVVSPNSNLPKDIELNQNFPNPFNPTTTIKYSINQNGKVKIVIFDILGRQVRSLVNENNSIGQYSVLWDGRNDAGKVVQSGQYYYTVEMDDITKTKKMILIK